jgi:peptide/nickel transport system substrate-binding protein
MKWKILGIAIMLSIMLMMLPPITMKVSGTVGIPNSNTIIYATIGGPDVTGGADPSWGYDTASATLTQQVYEPLFMYDNMSITRFVPMLADWWNGYTGDGRGVGDQIVPLRRSVASNLTFLESTCGIIPPEDAKTTWVFHIRDNVYWQNESYGTVKPSDFVYSIQRGMLQDAPTGVQWLMYTPLLGTTGTLDYASVPPYSNLTHDDYNYLGGLIKECVQGNDTTGYLAFNFIGVAEYPAFMQILTASWAFATCKQWCVERGCIDTDIALSNGADAANYTEFYTHWMPETSPLQAEDVIDGSLGLPMMGSGPYNCSVYNPDPHVGYEYFTRNHNYWGGWPGPDARSKSPVPSPGYCEHALIKVVESWPNRKAQFFSTAADLQCDMTDVPRPNCPELHLGGDKDGATYPGFNLTEVTQQLADYYFQNYLVKGGSLAGAFIPKWGNGTDCPTMLADRDFRLGIQYCFNSSEFIKDYFLGEASQPTTFMCAGTLFYNASKPVVSINEYEAAQHFKAAWNGRIWSVGCTVKLVYNIGNLGRQTIATMISDMVTRVCADFSCPSTITITPVGMTWAGITGAMRKQLSCFTIGWIADFPDPDDWSEPFIHPSGTYSGVSQSIHYDARYNGTAWLPANTIQYNWQTSKHLQLWNVTNVDKTNPVTKTAYPGATPHQGGKWTNGTDYFTVVAWVKKGGNDFPINSSLCVGSSLQFVLLTGPRNGTIVDFWNVTADTTAGPLLNYTLGAGPSYPSPAFTDAEGPYVSAINNTYVAQLVVDAARQTTANRSKMYNELMDIFFAEAASLPTDQGLGRHYERDWLHGWTGMYSNNVIAFGPYFYDMWKDVPTVGYPVYGVYLNAIDTITNTTVVPRLMQNVNGKMEVNGASVAVDYTVNATYENLTAPAPVTIWVTYGLRRFDPWTNEYLFVSLGTYSLTRGESLPQDVVWNETSTAENGTWVISFRAEPLGAPGVEIFPSNTTSLEVNSMYKAMIGPSKLGDIGTGYPLAFGKFDGKVTGPDLAMFLMCYKGTAPLEYKYLGDLGTGYPLKFYAYDVKVTGPDLAMFLMCYKGTGP